MVHNTLCTKKNRCIDLMLGPLNTGTYRLLKNLPPPPTGENLQKNLQHPVFFKTTWLQTLYLMAIPCCKEGLSSRLLSSSGIGVDLSWAYQRNSS